MDNYSQHISRLCEELLELGIDVEPGTIETILRSLELDFRERGQEVDPAREFEILLSRISNK